MVFVPIEDNAVSSFFLFPVAKKLFSTILPILLSCFVNFPKLNDIIHSISIPLAPSMFLRPLAS